VFEHGDEGTEEIEFHTHSESSILGIPLDQLDVALRRLQQYGLVRGNRIEATYVQWTSLRPTADGLRVLGEWPPPPNAAVDELLALVVSRLADEQLDGEDASAARRVVGSLARETSSIAGDVVKGELGRIGGELGRERLRRARLPGRDGQRRDRRRCTG
jgi:hypothetical protein